MNNDKKLATRLGEILASTLLICLAACLCGIMIALTIGFLRLIF